MKKTLYILLIIFSFFSCASKEAPVIEEPLALVELEPTKATPEPIKITEDEELTYINGVIVEIEMFKGEQKFIYIKTEKIDKDLPVGTEGEIFEDESYAKLVGKFKIKEIFPGYLYSELIEQLYTIKIEQPVRMAVRK